MTDERFVELLSDSGVAYHSYSGRFMYGRKCVAITTDSPYGVIARIMTHAESDDESWDLTKVFERTKQDSMGRSTVIYWPDIEWREKWNETDDENGPDMRL